VKRFGKSKTTSTLASERLAEFSTYVRRGQIEVLASYLHYTDLIDASAYAQSIDIAAHFARQHDIPLRTAMHADINGWSWALPDVLQARNIPYYCSMVHIDSGTDPWARAVCTTCGSVNGAMMRLTHKHRFVYLSCIVGKGRAVATRSTCSMEHDLLG
jgi:hypothetical protein